MASLEGRLEAAARTALPGGAPPEGALPRSEHGTPLEGTPPLLVVGEEVVFAGRGVGGGEDIDRTAETVRSDLRSWTRTEGVEDGLSFTIALWASPDSSADTLARLLRHAPPNARFALLVRGPALEPREGEPAWIEPAMVGDNRGRPETQRARFDAAWTRATASCPAAAPRMPVPAEVRQGGPLGAPSVHGLMVALRSCSCEGTDLAAIEAIARRALVDSEGPVLRLPAEVRFGAPTDAAPVVAVRPDETVEALLARIGDRAGPLWIRAQ